MMHFLIEFQTDNDAFTDDQDRDEIEFILSDIIRLVHRGDTMGKIKDSNGNTIGHWEHNAEDDE